MTITTTFLKRFLGFPSFAKRSFYRGMAVNSAPSTEWSPTYYWQERVENVEKYSTGGYHPIHLGDEFSHGRYRVIHKLGWGTFSTIWLAKDQVSNRYVALKVITADASERNSEAKIMRHLHQGNVDHPGRNFILSLLDEFSITGPNGRHQCIVTEVVGRSLARAKESTKNKTLPLKIARDITSQLALGLAYIHSRGILHGDLHSENISFQFPNMDSWTIEQVHERFGEPRTNQVFRLDDQPLGSEVPSYTVERAYLRGSREEDLPRKIKIIDFGEASFSVEQRTELGTPDSFRPPELFFDENITLPADIWAMACIIFEAFGKRPLFEHPPIFRASKEEVLSEMVDVLGMLPEKWWRKWENRSRYFDSDGTWTPYMSFRGDPRPLPERLLQMRNSRIWRGHFIIPDTKGAVKQDPEQMNREDAVGLMKLLMSMLEYEPSKRATAEEVVNSEWIQRLLRESGQG